MEAGQHNGPLDGTELWPPTPCWLGLPRTVCPRPLLVPGGLVAILTFLGFCCINLISVLISQGTLPVSVFGSKFHPPPLKKFFIYLFERE